MTTEFHNGRYKDCRNYKNIIQYSDIFRIYLELDNTEVTEKMQYPPYDEQSDCKTFFYEQGNFSRQQVKERILRKFKESYNERRILGEKKFWKNRNEDTCETYETATTFLP